MGSQHVTATTINSTVVYCCVIKHAAFSMYTFLFTIKYSSRYPPPPLTPYSLAVDSRPQYSSSNTLSDRWVKRSAEGPAILMYIHRLLQTSRKSDKKQNTKYDQKLPKVGNVESNNYPNERS